MLSTRTYIATLFLTALFAQQARGANELLQLNLAAGTQSNVTRGVDSMHSLGSDWLSARVFAGEFIQLGLNNSLTLGVSAGSEQYLDLPGFDRLSLGVSATLDHKFGLGAYAPLLGFNLSYRKEFLRAAARDNGELSAQLSLSKRISPAWLLRAGIDFADSDSDSLPYDPELSDFGYSPDISLPYEIYDFASASAFIEAEYTFQNQLMLIGSYRRNNGHTVASTTMPSLKTYKISKAFYPDPALPDGWYAYLLESNTDDLSLSLSVPVARDAAVDLSGRWLKTRAPLGKTYDNTIFSVGMSWRF